MPAPDSIKQLVERFEQHRDAYRAGKYNETQLRNEFLNPFLIAENERTPPQADGVSVR